MTRTYPAGSEPQTDPSPPPVLDVVDLVTSFHTEAGRVDAVRGISFSVQAGEVLAIVGESGSGKSVTAMSLLRMVRRPGRVESGAVILDGRDLMAMPEAELRKIRGRDIGYVFQDPVSSLNPLLPVRVQLAEAVRAHRACTAPEAEMRAVELMRQVGIPDPEARLNDYPLAFSGGMAQRVMIAMALINEPRLIIADEPTTALDVTIQAQILDLLAELNRRTGTAIILITHNLGVVARIAHRVAVMYAGQIVEQGNSSQIFASPRHPYTQDLLSATPRLTADRSRRLLSIEGRPPTLREAIVGCPYAARDPRAFDRCFSKAPPLTVEADGRSHACWLSEGGAALPDRIAIESSTANGARAVLPESPLLDVRGLTKEFPLRRRSLLGPRSRVRAVDGVALTIAEGETVGLVGESGCGKSTVAKLILGIEPATSGTIAFDGDDVTSLTRRGRRDYNREVQIVFQNPMSSLNPRMTVGDAIAEAIPAAESTGRRAREARVSELLELVGMEPSSADKFPHEFSGGQRQRIVIARALAVRPRLIVCDEAVAALDVSLQAQVINLLHDLQVDLGLSYLFIGHDLATVRHVSDRILVMYLGEIVESGPSEQVTAEPLHPYTASLISAVPEADPDFDRQRERIVLSGELPSPVDPPSACRFHTRCPIGPSHRPDRAVCSTTKPDLAEVRPGHLAACHFPGELAQLGSSSSSSSVPAGLGPVRSTKGRH